MRRREERRWMAIIGAIVVVAVVCSAYILHKQRVPSPFDRAYEMRAEFANVSAVIPNIGEPVTVAGVAVGQIAGVHLEDGRGVLTLRMWTNKLPRLHAGTRASLVANTPAKDMQVNLVPGDTRGPAVPEGTTIPLALTTSPVDADELLRALDGDTREWMQTLIDAVGEGTRGRGADLQHLLRALGPTATQLREISTLLASRREAIPQLVHNLRVLTDAADDQSATLSATLRSGQTTLAALAGQDQALSETLDELPPTLSALRGTLEHARPFIGQVRPTLDALRPTLRRLPQTVQELPDTLQGLLPLPLDQLDRFTRAGAPLGPHVLNASRDVEAEIGPLSTSFRILGETVNALNFAGDDGRSYLYWFSWFAHNANSMVSTEDAHGAVWRGLALLSCDSLAQPGALGDLLGLLGAKSGACGT